MNFKPTLWKGIVLLLIILFGPTIHASISFKTFVLMINPLIMPAFYLISVAVAIIIYIIWSIFQKRSY